MTFHVTNLEHDCRTDFAHVMGFQVLPSRYPGWAWKHSRRPGYSIESAGKAPAIFGMLAWTRGWFTTIGIVHAHPDVTQVWGLQCRSASLPGGNQVDGLPPASSGFNNNVKKCQKNMKKSKILKHPKIMFRWSPEVPNIIIKGFRAFGAHQARD